MDINNTHKAGFVNIIGKPNVGKSTIMNCMVGERSHHYYIQGTNNKTQDSWYRQWK
jgi:GTPase Era involved in 16S rRNA processing